MMKTSTHQSAGAVNKNSVSFPATKRLPLKNCVAFTAVAAAG